jgi:hypothetical protein
MGDEKESEKPTALKLSWTDYASADLNVRIRELRKIDQHVELDGRVEAIQFLRGVSSRASFVLPAFYAHMGSQMLLRAPNLPYSQRVLAAHTEHSSLLTLSLACRSVFDETRKRLTGKRFANVSDATLLSAAEFWAQHARTSIEESAAALRLLRELFRRCARPRKALLDAQSLLERRVGLVKYHADRQAAHITLEPFLFHLTDLVHVVAAIAVVGAMIIDFDDPGLGPKYLDAIDQAGWEAAKASFPTLPLKRLFENIAIHQQAKMYWKVEQLDGLNMLLNQLPAAMGYWESTNEAQGDPNAIS